VTAWRGATEGAGKRAAFALFYGPLHFLIVREIVRALDAVGPSPLRIVDLGCGTAAAGAAGALEAQGRPSVAGIDASGWAIGEAEWNLRTLGVSATLRRGNLVEAPMGAAGEGIVAAYAVSRLDDRSRVELLRRALTAHSGSRVLVVGPSRGGRSLLACLVRRVSRGRRRDDTWRFPVSPKR
jgi:hypothetical protein